MNMAKSVAKLLIENLRHPNGLPVECVIADTIGGAASRTLNKASAVRAAGRRGLGFDIVELLHVSR